MRDNSDNQLFQRDYQRQRRRLSQAEVQETAQLDGGTWTPTWVGTTIAGAYTYATQFGIWRRIEDLIYIEGQIAITAINTPPTGNMTIGGLPYAATSTASTPPASVAWGFISRVNTTAGVLALLGRIALGESVITLSEAFDNAVAVAYPAANFTNVAANVVFSAWYRTDS